MLHGVITKSLSIHHIDYSFAINHVYDQSRLTDYKLGVTCAIGERKYSDFSTVKCADRCKVPTQHGAIAFEFIIRDVRNGLHFGRCMTRAAYIYHPRRSMRHRCTAHHSRLRVILFHSLSRPLWCLLGPMWRIKHEWTERPSRGVNGTGLAGRNGDRERSAQRKLRVRYCNGDEERQAV